MISNLEVILLPAFLIGFVIMIAWIPARYDRTSKNVLGPVFVVLLGVLAFNGTRENFANYPDWTPFERLKAAAGFVPGLLLIFAVYGALRLFMRRRASKLKVTKPEGAE